MANSSTGKSSKLGRLRSSADFQKIKELGFRVRPSSWMVINFNSNESKGLRCGWTISRRVGNAVVRNRLKRWCRQYFREATKSEKVNLDVNVVLLQQKPGFYKEVKFSEFTRTVEKGWRSVLKRMQVGS